MPSVFKLFTLEFAIDKTHDETKQGEAFTFFKNAGKASSKKFYIESYGCAMNFADSEVVASILQSEGFGFTKHFQEADMIFLNTCSIREKAELTVRKRLSEFRKVKKIQSRFINRGFRLHGRKIKIKIY